MTASTNCNCRDCLPRGQEPAEVLTPREFAAVERFKAVYTVGANFRIDCNADAERLLDWLQFQRWRAEHGREGRP